MSVAEITAEQTSPPARRIQLSILIHWQMISVTALSAPNRSMQQKPSADLDEKAVLGTVHRTER
jgi:hypothetical protein